MQLRYRGLVYESNPAQIDTVETGLTASFRGLSYPVRCCVHLCIPPVKLRYRGVGYIKGQAGLTTSSKRQLGINPAIEQTLV